MRPKKHLASNNSINSSSFGLPAAASAPTPQLDNQMFNLTLEVATLWDQLK